MIVPQFWAEGRVQREVAGQLVTVRRFGWSDESPVAAQAHADERTREASDRIAAGETLSRRERKRAYNGADGVPIREEIVARHGESIVTRNSYGARCLNTPDVLFMDIDFETPMRGGVLGFAIGPAVIAGLLAGWTGKTWIGGLVAALIVFAVAWRIGLKKQRGEHDGNPAPEKRAATRIGRFIQQHPKWHLRVYRTPAGFRLLAMHRTFEPGDPAISDLFDQLGVDKVYGRMCRNQNCFRARLTAKPWRIAGMGDRRQPARGVWPVAPDKLPARDAWVEAYEKAAAAHAACHYLESVGSKQVHPSAEAVQRLHDELSRAESGLPLA